MFVDERAGSSAPARVHGTHPFDDPHYQGASVLLVNSNFGCGSSREHAPQALQRWGIRAIVGESFSDIFFGNAAIIGLPCVKAAADDVRTLMEQVERNPKTVIHVDLNDDNGRSRRFPLRRRAADKGPRSAGDRGVGYDGAAARIDTRKWTPRRRACRTSSGFAGRRGA